MLVKHFVLFCKETITRRRLLWDLAKNDFKQQYIGSLLGVLWAFIQPIILIALYWFVFNFGFKAAPMDSVPFICWLVSGLIPYFFFSEAWSKASNVIINYSYLVTKIVFPVRLLPIVKILSALYIHLFFICFVVALFAIYGFLPDLYYLQLPYYLFAILVLLLGVSWLTSAIQVFAKDVSQLIGIVLQLLFWGTPILYNQKFLPNKILLVLKLNPLLYIVQGYRDIFINKMWFWQHWQLTIYFWIVTFSLLILGASVFKRLRPYFADVL